MPVVRCPDSVVIFTGTTGRVHNPIYRCRTMGVDAHVDVKYSPTKGESDSGHPKGTENGCQTVVR